MNPFLHFRLLLHEVRERRGGVKRWSMGCMLEWSARILEDPIKLLSRDQVFIGCNGIEWDLPPA